MTTLLDKLLSKIRPEHKHEEVGWGKDVGKEILEGTVFDRLLPNLTPLEVQRGSRIEKEVVWEEGARCKECGDRMFWQKSWEKWVCRSWIYMEGGC